jgi:hypothetical protein
MTSLAVLLAAAGMAGAWYFGSGHEVKGSGDQAMLVFVSLAFAILGTVCAAYVLRSRVTLEIDSVGLVGLWGEKTIRRSDVLGTRRVHNSRGPDVLVLVSRWEGQRPLKITNMFAFDSVMEDWLSQLPDLDLEDKRKAEQELENDLSLGVTAQERQTGLAKARKLAQVLSITGLVSMFWAILFPAPYRLMVLVLVALPWIALLMLRRYKGVFRIDERRNDPHPNVALALMCPGMGLLMRAITDYHFVGWQRPVLWAVGTSAVMCGIALKLDPSVKVKGTIYAFFFLLLAYGFGAGMEANTLLDRGEQTLYETRVVSQYMSKGRSTSYHLRLDAWGSRTEQYDETVSLRLYQSVKPGDSVCMALRPGALGVPWYRISRCQ